MATYVSDGTLSDTQTQIGAASPGDIVEIPSGSYTWGASGESLSIDKAITVKGAGKASTTINASASSPPSYLISISAAATLKDFKYVPVAGCNFTTISGCTDFRLTGLEHDGSAASVYFSFIQNAYGLIDNNDIEGNSGTNELIFVRGPTDSWTTADSLGGADNVFIEDNTFTGSGYICDFNSNGRGVVRFNTAPFKADGHGLASNTPARGVRHMEIYNNTFTHGGFANAVEFRGGTGMIFDNEAPSAVQHATFTRPYIEFKEYGAINTWSNFNNTYQTPDNYPIGDQPGTGIDETVNVTTLSGGEMVRINTPGTTDFTLIGAADSNAGTQFIATGAGTGTGTVDKNTVVPAYVWNNDANGAAWKLRWNAIPQGAIDEYGQSFTMEDDIVKADRDYFEHQYGDSSFDGTSGMGRGTASDMNAITPTLTGVGFWVTDEGDWRTDQAGNDGRLYRWNGSAWALHYTPYTYPHPLRGGDNSSKSVSRAGRSILAGGFINV